MQKKDFLQLQHIKCKLLADIDWSYQSDNAQDCWNQFENLKYHAQTYFVFSGRNDSGANKNNESEKALFVGRHSPTESCIKMIIGHF